MATHSGVFGTCGACGKRLQLRGNHRLPRHTVDDRGTGQCTGAGRPVWASHTIRWRRGPGGVLRAVS